MVTDMKDAMGRATSDGGTDRGPDRSAEPSLVALVGDIVNDAQRLVKQHLDLFRHEVREDIRKGKRAAIAMGAAVGLGALGGVLLITMLIGLLAWAVPQVPWWGWCGILAGALLVASTAACASAKKMFASVTPMHEQTAEAIKEDIQWLKKK